MTRLETFLKAFPNAELDPYGYPVVFPCDIDTTYYKENCVGCKGCDAKFWNEEV